MRLFRLFVFVGVLCASLVNGFALDREAFTFTGYNLDVRIEPDQQRLGVRGKITLRNDSAAPQKNLLLQISSSLSWRSIQVNGKAVQFVSQPYTSDIDHTGALSEAIVTLPVPIPSKGTVDLDVGYEGVMKLDVTRLTRNGAPEEAARHSDWDQVSGSSSAVRGIGYVAWYPVATEAASLDDFAAVPNAIGRWKERERDAEFRVELCVSGTGARFPAVLMNDSAGGAAGRAGGTPDQSEVCKEHAFTPLHDIVPVFAIGDYLDLSHGNTSIQYLPGHKPTAEDYGLAVDLAVPFVTDWFGAPRQTSRLIDIPDPEAARFETGTVLFAPVSIATDARVAQMTAVHQLTHAALSSPRQWINEGLATFAQAAYREQQDGRQAALSFMGLYRGSLVDAEKAIAGDKNTSAADSLINTYIPELQRGNAMYVWWMLRDMIGDAALKKALAAYRPEQDKDPAYMQHLIEAQSKRDLEAFFDDWVYRDRGLPDFRVSSAYLRPTVGGQPIVTVTIENIGGAGAEVPFTLHMENGELMRRIYVPAKSKASTRVEASSTPRKVVINDGSVPESDTSNNSFTIETLNH